jgi:hypothetical protein
MPTTISGSANADFATPLPVTEGGTGLAVSPITIALGGTGAITAAAAAAAIAPIQLQTFTASTSGTSIDYTSIPSGVNRITVMMFDVSLSGTSRPQIQLGVSSTAVTTGYDVSGAIFSVASMANATYTTGFVINTDAIAAYGSTGQMIFNRVTGNTWVGSGSSANTTSSEYMSTTAGGIALAGELDMIRITTVNGTDTFDVGSVNISWEF